MGRAERTASRAQQDERYVRAVEALGPAVERLARAFEADRDLQRDLLQEIHFAIWRSFARFDGRCSEATWVYRVSHNVAATHALKQSRARAGRMVTLEELEAHPDPGQPDPEAATAQRQALARLTALVRTLEPPDRQVALLYLEGVDGQRIAEICGISAGAVATKVHRLKAVLAQRFHQGGGHDR
jgi:RNA polymerase sigma-70 factor (ECF subfamily)